MRTDVLSRLRRLSTSVRIAEYTDDDDDDDDTDGSGARVLAASAAAASARAPRVLAASAAAASAASVAASKHLIDPPVPRTAGRQCVRFTLTHMHPPSRYITPFTHMPPLMAEFRIADTWARLAAAKACSSGDGCHRAVEMRACCR